MTLTTAKAAFNDQNYESAAEGFREFLKLGAGNKGEVAAARYGLGVCLIEGPAKDYKAAAEMLQSPAGQAGFKDAAYAHYYLGVAQRNLGEPAAGVKAGQRNLEAAAAQFGLAAEAFAGMAPPASANAADLAAEWEWVAKARCDQADVLLRLGQFKAAATAAGAIAEDAKFAPCRYRPQAAYQFGYASFGLKDYAAAVRSLSTLAPFDQGQVGVHARYLLARTHHLAGERPEAVADYQALIAAWETQRKDARAKLADPGAAALKPGERERLEAAVKAGAPDYVARAMFYWGVALSEFGSADEAMNKFMAVIQLGPESPVAAEARLRAAQAGVQVRKFKEAAGALTPLVEHPQYADQALRYLAKAQYGIGTTPVPKGGGVAAALNAVADPDALAAAVKQAAQTLQKAAERAKAMMPADPAAGGRRAVILLELGDMLQLDHQYKEAAAAYAAGAGLGGAEVVEQLAGRQAIALQLAGEYAEADKVCKAFLNRYPKSGLRADVSVRYAENALLAAHSGRGPADASKRAFGEAVARFTRVIEQFPETPQANLARMGLATVQYLQGQFAAAAEMLAKIPEGERADDLIGAALLLADCQLRALPESADDALSSARVAAQLEQITTALEAFLAARPDGAAAAADALVRIGYASRKLSGLLADPAEKRRTLSKAMRAYAGVVQRFPDHPLYPVALLEQAKALALFNGAAPAVMQLSKFAAPPLDKSPLAPLALIHLADAQRVRRHPDEAIRLLTQVRGEHEAELLKDPQRAEWVPVLQYSLALSYKEAGKYEPARELFEKLAKDYAKRPEGAEAAWRIAQCQTDPAMAEVEGKRRALMGAAKPQTQGELLASLLEATKRLRTAAERMGEQAAAAAAKGDESDLPAKMNHDAAWCWRLVGEVEVEAARRALQAEAMRKLVERLAQAEPATRPPLSGKPAETPLSAIPMQPGEKLAREKFKAVIEGGGDSPLADEARLDLAELYGQRDEADAAVAVLKEALAKGPAVDLAERLKIRLAALYLAAGDAKSAGAVAEEIMAGQRNAYAYYGRVLAVEAAYRQKDYAAVIEQAKAFLDGPRGVGKLSGVTDHALLRMADAQGKLGEWQAAKGTLETWFARFPSTPLTFEAKYTMGWVCENLKDADAAVAAYDYAARGGGELGAKANLQVGRIRLAQDRPADALRPLLTVAYAYDDPDLNPAAMCEAARALVKLNKPAEARRLLERAAKDFPSGPWAVEAKKQLGEVK